MNLSRLAKIDLNLLVALHILIEEGSVSIRYSDIVPT